MHDWLLLDIQANGLLSAVPYLLYWLVCTSSGYVVDWLLQHEYVSTAVARKTVNTVGMLGPAILICLLAFTDCNSQFWAVIILSLTVALSGCCFSGFVVNYMDVRSRCLEPPPLLSSFLLLPLPVVHFVVVHFDSD